MAITEGMEVPGILGEAMKPKPRRTTSISPGGVLVDEDTGAVIARGNAPVSTARPEYQWVKRNGQYVEIPKGSAQPGDEPRDAVADRQQAATDAARDERLMTVQETARLATALRNHEGFAGTFGLYGSYIPTVRQSTAEAEDILKSLQGLLTLANTGKLKGVLSNSDMLLLQRASTTLTNRMGEKAAGEELDRIIEVMGRAAAKLQTAGGDDVDAFIDSVLGPMP